MKQTFYKFICDESGVEVLAEADIIDHSSTQVPDGWGLYRDDDKKEFHFSSKANWEKFWKKEEVRVKKEKTPKSYQIV